MKPNLYKSVVTDAIVKALAIALNDDDFNSYFDKLGIKILGIEGIGLKNNKRDGIILCVKNNLTDEIKHAKIDPVIKGAPYETFAEYIDYETQAKMYEEETGKKISEKKNKITQDFEVLPESITSKIGDINKIAEEVFRDM